MSDEVKPALTREEEGKPALTRKEWEELIRYGDTIINRADEAYGLCPDSSPAFRHAQAAADLHGQPFGFTRGDVLALRDAANVFIPDLSFALLNIADRIEALLPPEDVQP